MSIKVGINGFGRIGRMVMRCCMDHPNIEIVGINDLCPADYLAYMLKFDTMHGKFKGTVSAEGSNIVVNGKSIPVFAERDPANLPWAKVGAEYVRLRRQREHLHQRHAVRVQRQLHHQLPGSHRQGAAR